MQFADPKNDLAFKKIFGDEKQKNMVPSKKVWVTLHLNHLTLIIY